MTRRGHRLTIRMRLTLAFSALVAAAGAVMIVVVGVAMRSIPAGSAVGELVGLTPRADGSLDPARATEDSVQSGLPPVYGSSPSQVTSEVLNATLVIALGTLLLVIAAAAVLAWIVAGRFLQPVRALNAAATLAGDGSLSHRLGARRSRDELDELSTTFDAMLDRLESSFQRQRHFAANASHELLTPIAATQTLLEVALDDPSAPESELRQAARRVLEMNERNAAIVEALLQLVSLDRVPLEVSAFSTKALLDDVLADVRDEADRKRVTIRARVAQHTAAGQQDLLRQAIANLVRNGVRHNRPEGQVDVAIERDGERLTFRVENTGEVMDPETIVRMGEPFFRGSGRVSAADGGHGLGLSLVRAIADAHEGGLDLAPRPGGGLIATLWIPSDPGA